MTYCVCYFSGFVCITGCDNPRNPVMLPSIDQLLSGAREFYSWQMAEWALRHVWRYNITLNLHEDCCSFLADFHLPHLISPECRACAWVWPVKPHYRDVTMSHCFLWPDVTTVTRPSWHSLPRHLLSRVTHRAPVHRVSWELRSRPVNIIIYINILTKRKKEGVSWCVIEMFLWSHSSRYPPSPWLHCTLSWVPRVRDNSIKTWSKLIYKQSRYTAIHLFTASYTLLLRLIKL